MSSMAGPISHSLAFNVSPLTGGMFKEDNRAFTCVAPIPACSIPVNVNKE